MSWDQKQDDTIVILTRIASGTKTCSTINIINLIRDIHILLYAWRLSWYDTFPSNLSRDRVLDRLREQLFTSDGLGKSTTKLGDAMTGDSVTRSNHSFKQ